MQRNELPGTASRTTATQENDLLENTITDAEIAAAYDVSGATVRRWAALGKLPPKVGPSRKARRNREAVRRALSGEGRAA